MARSPFAPTESTLVSKVVGLLHDELSRLPENRPLLPELRLAEKYGVGRKTIRAAMTSLASRGLICRVRGRGTFPARGEKANLLFRTRVVRLGVVSCPGYFESPERRGFYDLILQGMLDEVLKRKGELVIGGGSPDSQREACRRMIADPHIDGLALISVMDQDFIASLANGKPICLVDHYSTKAAIDCVRVDSFGSACLAVEHLHNLGHRKIAYLQPDRPDINPSRLEGYRAALKRLGLAFAPELVVGAGNHPKGGAEAVTQLLALKPAKRPTAVLAFSNNMAVGAVEGIVRFGLSVPRDISVVGAGGGVLAAMPGLPELTSIRYDPAEMGRIAVEYLCDRLGGPEIEPRNTVVPAQLRFGTSTAAPPKREGRRDDGEAYAGRPSRRTRPVA